MLNVYCGRSLKARLWSFTKTILHNVRYLQHLVIHLVQFPQIETVRSLDAVVLHLLRYFLRCWHGHPFKIKIEGIVINCCYHLPLFLWSYSLWTSWCNQGPRIKAHEGLCEQSGTSIIRIIFIYPRFVIRAGLCLFQIYLAWNHVSSYNSLLVGQAFQCLLWKSSVNLVSNLPQWPGTQIYILCWFQHIPTSDYQFCDISYSENI